MNRVIVTLLLTASLLACPLRCWSLVVACADTPTIAATSCGDCCEPESDSSQPQCPEDDCNCGNCICHGAVYEGGTAVDSVALLCLAGLSTSSGKSLSLAAARNSRIYDCLSCPSGRAARIAHQSLLI